MTRVSQSVPSGVEPDDENAPVRRASSARSLRSVVAPEELSRWREPVPWKTVRDLSAVWIQILGAIALFVTYPGVLTFVLAFLLVGGGQHGLILVAHEFTHFSVLPRSRRWNDAIGTWLFAAPAGVPLPLFRQRHFAHHRTYSTPEDTKSNYRWDYRGKGLWLRLLRGLSGWEYVAKLLNVGRAARVAGADAASPIAALPPIVATQVILIALFALIDVRLYLALWVLPLVTVSALLDALRATKEHQPLDAEGGGGDPGAFYKGTPGPFVRSVRATWLERLFLCKINFCYHAEHHLWPQVSYQYLPEIHRRLVREGAFDDPQLGYERGYLSTIGKLWREPIGTPKGTR